MQRDLHLIYKQIPVIWIKAGKPTSDTQKVRGKKEQLKILQGHNLAHTAKHKVSLFQNGIPWTSGPQQFEKRCLEVPGNENQFIQSKLRRLYEIGGKKRGHTVLSPSTSWHLSFPENPVTAVQRVGKKWS